MPRGYTRPHGSPRAGPRAAARTGSLHACTECRAAARRRCGGRRRRDGRRLGRVSPGARRAAAAGRRGQLAGVGGERPAGGHGTRRAGRPLSAGYDAGQAGRRSVDPRLHHALARPARGARCCAAGRDRVGPLRIARPADDRDPGDTRSRHGRRPGGRGARRAGHRPRRAGRARAGARRRGGSGREVDAARRQAQPVSAGLRATRGCTARRRDGADRGARRGPDRVRRAGHRGRHLGRRRCGRCRPARHERLDPRVGFRRRPEPDPHPRARARHRAAATTARPRIRDEQLQRVLAPDAQRRGVDRRLRGGGRGDGHGLVLDARPAQRASAAGRPARAPASCAARRACRARVGRAARLRLARDPDGRSPA